jgi:transcriptional regulator with XRE-family HTH domain
MSKSTPFGELLRKALENRGISAREASEKLGKPETYLGRAIQGIRTLSLAHLPALCRILKLAPGTPERATFERMAYLSHAPQEVHDMVDDLESQLAKEREQFRLILSELKRLGIELPESIRDL